MGSAQDAIEHFRSFLGTGEQPPGSNCVPGITDFLHTGNGSTPGNSPWCAEMVSRVLSDVNVRDLYGLQYVNGCAYVPYITRAYRSWGRFFTNPLPGDLAVFVWGGSGSDPEGDHIGMVIEQTAPNRLRTIEGNSPSSPPDGHGEEVAEHSRSRSLILGFCRPSYGAQSLGLLPLADVPPYGHNLMLTSPNLMHDDYVRQWQEKMHSRGWSITVDGWFGKESDRICRQFQVEKGLLVDGIVGPTTWAATWTEPVT